MERSVKELMTNTPYSATAYPSNKNISKLDETFQLQQPSTDAISKKYDKEYLEAIITEYQPDCPEPLTLADAEEIADVTIGLGEYVIYLQHKYKDKLNSIT
jgi:hypothetical protein